MPISAGGVAYTVLGRIGGVRNSTSVDKPALLVTPFSESQARGAQEAWAKQLNTQVEITNSIGMKLRLIPAGEFLMGLANSSIRFAKARSSSRGFGSYR